MYVRINGGNSKVGRFLPARSVSLMTSAGEGESRRRFRDVPMSLDAGNWERDVDWFTWFSGPEEKFFFSR